MNIFDKETWRNNIPTPEVGETIEDVVCLLLRGNNFVIHLYGEGKEVASFKKNGGLNGRVIFHESITGLLKTSV